MCPTHSVWGFVFSLGSDIPSSVQEVLPWYPVAVEDHEAIDRRGICSQQEHKNCCS